MNMFLGSLSRLPNGKIVNVLGGEEIGKGYVFAYINRC